MLSALSLKLPIKEHLVGTGVTHVGAVQLVLVVVVEIPEGEGLVPDGQHRYAQLLHHRPCYFIAPTTLHYNLLFGVCCVQMIVFVQIYMAHLLRKMLQCVSLSPKTVLVESPESRSLDDTSFPLQQGNPFMAIYRLRIACNIGGPPQRR